MGAAEQFQVIILFMYNSCYHAGSDVRGKSVHGLPGQVSCKQTSCLLYMGPRTSERITTMKGISKFVK